MNIETYISSGIIETYCLGLSTEAEAQEVETFCMIYPIIKAEVEALQMALNGYARSFKKRAPLGLKKAVFDEIDALERAEAAHRQAEQPFLLKKMKVVSADSKVEEWQELLQGIEPPAEYDVHMQPLYMDDKDLLFVAWVCVGGAIPEEVHDDMYESFYVLEGTCTCIVGDKKYDLKAGDFLPIPLYTEHSIVITSPTPVKALVQRRMVA